MYAAIYSTRYFAVLLTLQSTKLIANIIIKLQHYIDIVCLHSCNNNSIWYISPPALLECFLKTLLGTNTVVFPD